ncbi:hypothetical protein FOA52_010832 [Chlamydomonas sp. UWO 241]|nr:hypothetical protein FOA52_010832 [Chlamydomonas sp. UWO 241]
MAPDGQARSPMPSVEELPAPVVAQEVAFRRLLVSCTRLLDALGTSGSIGTAAGGTTTSTSPGFDPQAAKLKHYMETLQEQLADLERSHAIELGFKTLSSYRQLVSALAARAPPVSLPSYAAKPAGPRPKPPAAAAPAAAASAYGTGASSQPALALGSLGRSGSGGGGGGGGGRGGAGGGASTMGGGVAAGGADASRTSGGIGGALGAAAKATLAHQQATHDALTDELVEMAAALKRSTLGVQEAVKRRGNLADAAEAHLDTSLVNARDVVKRSKEQYKRGSGTFWLTIGVVLIVSLVFTSMIVWIKFSYLLGYRAPSSRAPPPRQVWQQGGEL